MQTSSVELPLSNVQPRPVQLWLMMGVAVLSLPVTLLNCWFAVLAHGARTRGCRLAVPDP
jgi:hypothetical protein